MKTGLPKILLCEDDLRLGQVTKDFFEVNGFEVILERDGKLGLAAFRKYKVDLCLLDVMMPNMNGYQLATEIRNISKEIPIIFLTAKSMKEDVLQGYVVGADDYINKPFDPDVLLMKVTNLLKRIENREKEKKTKEPLIIKLGSSYKYNLQNRELKFDAKNTQTLSPTEGKLLMLLYQYRESCLQRDLALREIWNDDSRYSGRSMDVYITKLRKHFDLDPKIQILNIHSTGFLLVLGGSRSAH